MYSFFLESGGKLLNLNQQLVTGQPQFGYQILSGLTGMGLPVFSSRWYETVADGSKYRGRRVSSREIQVNLNVRARNRDEMRTLVDNLLEVLMGEPFFVKFNDGTLYWGGRFYLEGGGDITWGETLEGNYLDMIVSFRMKAEDTSWIRFQPWDGAFRTADDLWRFNFKTVPSVNTQTALFIGAHSNTNGFALVPGNERMTSKASEEALPVGAVGALNRVYHYIGPGSAPSSVSIALTGPCTNLRVKSWLPNGQVAGEAKVTFSASTTQPRMVDLLRMRVTDLSNFNRLEPWGVQPDSVPIYAYPGGKIALYTDNSVTTATNAELRLAPRSYAVI